MLNTYNCLILAYIALMDITTMQTDATASYLQNNNFPCCDGILGYLGPHSFMPCSDLRCCNERETVALQRVNHALGFWFRCMLE